MLTLKQLNYALAVAQTRHFRKAAEHCGVSQSAISTAIAELENTLGVQLFERDNKKVFITAVGEELLNQAQDIQASVDNLFHTAQRDQRPLSYPIKMGFIPTIAPYLLPKVLPAVREAYPALEISLFEETSARLCEKLKSGELDTGVLALPYPTDGLHAFSFWPEDFYAIFHSKNVSSKQNKISAAQLREQPLLLLEDGHCLKDHALKVCEMDALSKNATVVGTSLHTLIQMALSNMGTTLIPEMALEQVRSQNKELKALKLDEPSPHRELAFVTRLNYPGVSDILKLKTIFEQALKAHA